MSYVSPPESSTSRHPDLPTLTPENEAYWQGGAAGELRIRRCRACRFWVEGPSPLCPSCWGRDLVPEATTGRGTVYTFSTTYNTNYEAFGIGRVSVALPYITAIVESRRSAVAQDHHQPGRLRPRQHVDRDARTGRLQTER